MLPANSVPSPPYVEVMVALPAGSPEAKTTLQLLMDGLSVQGKRRTHTIPAAQAGSAKDIQVVTETWYSADLQMVVMSKTSDPRFGDSVYQVTNISRAEPDPSLFTVPADYTVQPGHGFAQGHHKD